MRTHKEDGIDIVNLKDGKHRFEWDFSDDFFECFEGSSLKKGNIHAVLIMNRVESVFKSELHVTGHVGAICDNCLNEIDVEVDNELSFVVKLTDVPAEDDVDKEVYYVNRDEGKFFVGQHVYDLVYLGLPIRSTCKNTDETNSCNPEMLKRLNNINNESNNGEDEKDPRWDKLKDLLK